MKRKTLKLNNCEYTYLTNIVNASLDFEYSNEIKYALKNKKGLDKDKLISLLEDYIYNEEYDISDSLDFSNISMLSRFQKTSGASFVRLNKKRCEDGRYLVDLIEEQAKDTRVSSFSSDWWRKSDIKENVIFNIEVIG